MNRETEYIIYLKRFQAKLNRVVKKLDQKRDLEDEDKDVIKFTIEAFLKMYKEL